MDWDWGGGIQITRQQPDTEEVDEEGCYTTLFSSCCELSWRSQLIWGRWETLQIRKPRKKRRVMGCELNRQLSSPWRGCRAGSSMVMGSVKECLEMESQCLAFMRWALYWSHWRGGTVSWQQRFVGLEVVRLKVVGLRNLLATSHWSISFVSLAMKLGSRVSIIKIMKLLHEEV